MRTLLLLRHAKSSWKDPGLADHDRPLNGRGRRDAPRMAEWIADEGLAPDLIVSSTAARAVATADAVGAACDRDVVYCRELYHAGPREALEAILLRVTAEARSVMWVGHNPGLESAVEALAGEYARLPTAALARIDLELEDWANVRLPIRGELVGVWRPRELWASA